LLERTIKESGRELSFFIIEGDQQSMNDANRIHAAGAPVVQVNTGEGCHLDAEMVNRAVKELEPAEKAVLMIENVGNLVCPALFDLGESFRVVIMSTTEGEDKPLKYPYMFRSSDLCIINKTDLLPYLDFDLEKAKEFALQINQKLQFIELSVKTGDGMPQWYDWLKDKA
jgi:hydrogenase nickel incorporation protein HypB